MAPRIDRADQRLLATWAAACAEHVLPCFAELYPNDDRPRRAIETCRAWVETGEFHMAVIRGASLAAHAAAREAPEGSAARFAARAAGQAVATAHAPTHAVGAAWYGIKATDVAGVLGERAWQYRRLPNKLRPIVARLARERPVLGRVLQYPTPRRAPITR